MSVSADKPALVGPARIRTLRQAGIQVWVLTGDKVDTAVTIATSCDLLNPTMHVTRITSPDPTTARTPAVAQWATPCGGAGGGGECGRGWGVGGGARKPDAPKRENTKTQE